MRSLNFYGLALTVAVAVAACTAKTSDGPGTTGTATPTQTGVASPTPNGGDTLTADTTWSGAQQVPNNLTINPGVTLTVDSSAVVALSPGVTLFVQGNLVVNGSATTPVVFDVTGGSGAGSAWNGFEIQAGGSAVVKYVTINDATYPIKVETGAVQSAWLGLTVNSGSFPFQIQADSLFCRTTLQGAPGTSQLTGGKTTFQDSMLLRNVAGAVDALQFSGTAQLELDYSTEDGGANIGWHCLTHSGAAGGITVSHSIMQNAHYAFMVGGNTGTISNSFIAIQNQVDEPGSDFSPATISGYTGDTITANGNYWANVLSSGLDGTPASCQTVQSDYVNSGYTVSTCAASSSGVLSAAGPRAATLGCESTFPNPMP